MVRLILLSATAVGAALLPAGAAAPAHPAPPTAHAAKRYLLGVSPNRDLRFTRNRIVAAPGSITLILSNGTPLGHGIAVAGKSGRIVEGPGVVSRVTVRLKAGTYAYYCPVSGHRAAGMSGRLIVR